MKMLQSRMFVFSGGDSSYVPTHILRLLGIWKNMCSKPFWTCMSMMHFLICDSCHTVWQFLHLCRKWTLGHFPHRDWTRQ